MAELKPFKRGLNDDARDLVRQFLSSPVGRKLRESPETDICIRDNYINVYRQGCSILKFSPLAQANVFVVHWKYLPESQRPGKTDYVSLAPAGSGEDLRELQDLTWGEGTSYLLDFLAPTNAALNAYLDGNGEKAQLSEFLLKAEPRPFVLDLEVAFSRSSDLKRKPVADRVDLALLDTAQNQVVLVEYKLHGDPRLRAVERPEIMDQMRHYAGFLERSEEDIRNSYKAIAQNYIDLDLLDLFPGQPDESRGLLERFIREGTVDTVPRLLIECQGSDSDTLIGRGREDHLAKLERLFQNKGYAFHPQSLRTANRN